MKFGIDISKWQGDFNLQGAVSQDGVEFVIVKCGGSDAGVYTDKQFENNYKKAKAIGLPIGAYWFSQALTQEEAIRDAEYCYNLLKGKQFELPIYIDVENRSQLNVGKEKLTNIIDTFLAYLEQRGYYVGIYSSQSYFKTYMDESKLKKYAFWIAKWSETRSIGGGLWQFGGETNKLRSNKIQGITVDQDYLYVDYEKVIKEKGLNGFGIDNTIKLALEDLIQKGYTYSMIQDVLNKMKGE